VQSLSDEDFSNEALPYFRSRRAFIGEVPVIAQRLSYVGELGWELYTTADYGQRLWDFMWNAGKPLGIIAAGRAAFESMRIEKGYRLWGVDMDSNSNPFEVGLGFTVKPDKGEFIGRDALARIKSAGGQRKLCCLELADPAVIPMGKEPIIVGEDVVGYVTSATYACTVEKSIAYGYVPVAASGIGSELQIELFGQRHLARVTCDPVFDSKGERMKR
jgi:glycine cleavage system aminomethyltransferase T